MLVKLNIKESELCLLVSFALSSLERTKKGMKEK